MNSNSNSESAQLSLRTPTPKKMGREARSNNSLQASVRTPTPKKKKGRRVKTFRTSKEAFEKWELAKTELDEARSKLEYWDRVYRNSSSLSPFSQERAEQERRNANELVDVLVGVVKAEWLVYTQALRIEANEMSRCGIDPATPAGHHTPLTPKSELTTQILKNTYGAMPELLIPWVKIHEQLPTERKKNLRGTSATFYWRWGRFSKVHCMVTGSLQNAKHVKDYRILPHSTTDSLLRDLDIPKARNDPQNVLLLCTGIGDAFARNQISFLPCEDKDVGWYKIQMLDPSARHSPIFHGSEKCIGDYVGHTFLLHFKKGEEVRKPWTRALEYHAHCSHAMAKCKRWLDQDSSAFPSEFGTPVKARPLVMVWNLSEDELFQFV